MLLGMVIHKIGKTVIKKAVQGSNSSNAGKKILNGVKSTFSTVNAFRNLAPIPIIKEQLRGKVIPKFGSVLKLI